MQKPSFVHAAVAGEPGPDPSSYIMGLAKGMAVLESFDTERQRLNTTTAAQRAGISRAAARRCLLTLTQIGYLETDGSNFWLSAKVLKLSGSYFATARIPRIVQHMLDRTSAQVSEYMSATVLDGDEVVVVARGGPSSSFRAYGLHLGARLSAHATSTGRVLLASLAGPELDRWFERFDLQRLTLRTVVQKQDFRQLLDQVRIQDYCVASEEHELGVSAIAVPLRDLKGHTVAALNTIVPTEQLGANSRRLLGVLQETARELRPML